jgi:acetoacetyl-CoA synthetase
VYAVLAAIGEVEDALVVNLDLPDGGFFMPLFVKLAPGAELDAALEEEIRQRLRREYTPRHVPDAIVPVPAIPATLTGKKMEVPVRKILLGAEVASVANVHAMADPSALEAFAEYAASRRASRGR